MFSFRQNLFLNFNYTLLYSFPAWEFDNHATLSYENFRLDYILFDLKTDGVFS